MGNCIKIPKLHVDTDVDTDSKCCNNDDCIYRCPSSCCVIQIFKSKSNADMTK